MASADKRQAAAVRQKSVEEEVLSLDSMPATTTIPNPNNPNIHQPITLSKKAIHQRDADENLFLRFLELDPPNEVPTSGGTKQSLGRTPFTMTKKLTRTSDRGFGFSIVWTHPPRIEKIESNLSADINGILPGDYVIFIDKHNVVTMPEADVLNLIRSQGNTLTMETFRRSGSSSAATGLASSAIGVPSVTTSSVPSTTRNVVVMNGGMDNNKPQSRVTSAASNYTETLPVSSNIRPSTACSSSSTMEAAKKRLHLPQVTFSKESIAPITDNRHRFLLQLISREQNFISAILFGIQRFVQPLVERNDLISPSDHRTLFQNIDELRRISEDILDQLINDDQEPQINFTSRVYLSKTTAICAAYKKYCNGIKRADCVLVNKSRQAGSKFVAFITEPQVPRKRPDLTQFIHRPLQHFREILKLMQMLASNCHVDSEEHKNFTSVINELQAAYREITVSSGLMEPLGEGRPLLTLQDLESRMVFTKCKPFTLAVQGRQWIFGGDLSRVEGRSVKPYWTLLFSDIIVFAKVSRDRVLFIMEEPISIANIVDSCFHMRKKTAEFRITVDPNGRFAESPTGYCAPDLTRTPKKSARRKSLTLRAPSLELKAVWQNLLQRQIFLVNAALGSTPLSSPLDSPDVLNTSVPLCEIGMATASVASMKLSSLDSINLKNQQSQQRYSTNPAEQFEMLIDEKCRILNKTGTSKASALHLANWMKGQLDKQQEEARLAAERARENLRKEDEHLLYSDGENYEKITYWTRAQLENRTKELNLAKEQGNLRAQPNFAGKRLSGVEELNMSECDNKSQSHSTTSDSQITIRSSPVVNVGDKLSVCRHCHTNCQQKLRSSSISPPNLICNSLKVQHSQASPNRCCRFNSKANSSISGTSTSTVTGEEPLLPTSTKTSSNESNLLPLQTVSQTDESITGEQFTTSLRVLNESNNSKKETTLHNGHCSSGEDTKLSPESSPSPKKHTAAIPPPKPNRYSIKNRSPRKRTTSQSSDLCNCECTPADFEGTAISPDKVTHERCKLIEPTTTISRSPLKSTSPQLDDKQQPTQQQQHDPHKYCKCVCKDCKDDDFEGDDNLSLMLIGLAQLTPVARVVQADSSAFVPSIAVVPPTPDALLSKTTTNVWDNTTSIITSTATKLLFNNVPRQAVIENIPDDSADESPQDEEPPYRQMNCVSLRRYGTLSSLEKLPSEDIPDDTRSSDGDYAPDELDDDNEEQSQDVELDSRGDDDIEVVTKKVFSPDESGTKPWTSRAGSYVAGKMPFFEESRAFIDKYLGRWNSEHQGMSQNGEDLLDDCTSGATSGEEVWGTPTSGGENDERHLNSENTQSSPTKSSTSYNDDDDTELMMDELLMAPPMTASTIRGLLPRRRLEPLFEEETESDEEKTQQESEELKKGETTTNGHNLRDSTESSSDEMMREDLLPQPPTTTPNVEKDRYQLNQELELNNLDGCHQQKHQLLAKGQIITTLPNVVSHAVEVAAAASEMQMISSKATTSSNSSSNVVTTEATRLIQMMISSLTTTTATTVNSSTSITNNVESNNTSPIPKAQVAVNSNTTFCKTVVRKKEFSPPPPPPRRLMLTQTNLRSANTGTGPNTQQAVLPQSGATADSGLSVDVVDNIHKRLTQINQKAVFNSKSYAASTGPAASQQPTIIETSLLGPAHTKKSASMSSSIVSTTKKSTTITKVEKPAGITTKTQPPAADNNKNDSTTTSAVHHGSGLSPRLEMRLALNHDILGDEDLINYDPGPDLTTILGHDLTTFHRLTGRDLLTRTVSNRVQPKEAVISFCQQRNSKMDTPTVNRRPRPVSIGGADLIGVAGIAGDMCSSSSSLQQRLQSNRNTLSNFAFAPASDLIQKVAATSDTITNLKSTDEKKLSGLEILARREKMYSMSQSKNGSLVKKVTTVKKAAIGLMRTRSTSSVASAVGTMENDQQQQQLAAAQTAAVDSKKIMGRSDEIALEAGKE
ncbi:serine-rich adhesin for platelets isoform X2 [Episyrphus balteatus]|uniref:serine-rich adhesin for platelets isoform X2 n=1 Tax=Episyrphus balteatus TaxID=286459 RepID=UPI002485F8C4|nr:serine-rich adhesin for platelets isoform X2 [Episyrphus balteatus]